MRRPASAGLRLGGAPFLSSGSGVRRDDLGKARSTGPARRALSHRRGQTDGRMVAGAASAGGRRCS